MRIRTVNLTNFWSYAIIWTVCLEVQIHLHNGWWIYSQSSCFSVPCHNLDCIPWVQNRLIQLSAKPVAQQSLHPVSHCLYRRFQQWRNYHYNWADYGVHWSSNGMSKIWSGCNLTFNINILRYHHNTDFQNLWSLEYEKCWQGTDSTGQWAVCVFHTNFSSLTYLRIW